MRKVILLEHISLDGFMAGPNGEMDWITFDNELETYVHSLHDTTDAEINGRKTFQMMESYWPGVLADPTSTGGALKHARWLDGATKIVVSKTLDNVQWKNTVIIRDNIAAEINKMKQQPGKDMVMVGSASLAHTFLQLGLIDEYWINVNPVVVGSGIPLFPSQESKRQLTLLNARTFGCGVVSLRYAAG